MPHNLNLQRPRTIVTLALALLLSPLILAAAVEQDYAAPYRVLREANLRLDAQLAASAYADGAKLIFEQPDGRGDMFQGKQDIGYAYRRTFSQVDPGTPIEIEFRFHTKQVRSHHHNGAYRLAASVGGKPFITYGGFSVRLTKQNGSWRFEEDRGWVISAAQFHALPKAQL